MQSGVYHPSMLGLPEQEYVPSTIEKVLTYAMIGSGYAFTALRYGWIPLCIVLGGSSLYCAPSFSINKFLGVDAATQPPQPGQY
jgi:hypothetical protein